MNKLKDYIIKNKKKVIIFTIFFILILFTIGYFVLAEDDEYANEILVNASISKIEDGTPNNDGKFDSNDSAGNDSSSSNKRVRNYDSIGYTIDYGAVISQKKTTELANQGYSNPSVYRKIYVEVFIPKSLNASISRKSESGEEYNTTSAGDYIYARYTLNDVLATVYSDKKGSNFTFWINNIDTANNTVVSPIILLYDSATTTEKNIDSTNFNIDTYKSGKTQISMSNNGVTVTGVESYNVYLLPGSSELGSDGNRTFSAAVILGLVNDSNRGIKGKIAPTTSSFNLNFSSTGYSSFNISKPTNDSYDYSENSGFTIKSGSNELPYTKNLTSSGNLDDETFEINNETFAVSLNNIVNKDLTASYYKIDNTNIKIAAQKVFRFTAVRDSSNTSDSTITLNAVNSSQSVLSNTLTFNDYKEEFVGSISSKLDFYNSTSTGMSSTPQTSGEAVYNYEEPFYINNLVKYASTSGGATVSDFTNYIKVDNSAIDVIIDNEENYKFITLNDKELDTENYEVTYYYGDWTTDYITKSSSASSYSSCPSDLSSLSREELMNLYGGPCVTLTDKVLKSDTIIDTSSSENDEYNIGIMLVATKINSVKANDKINIKLRAMIKSDQSLVNTTHQVVTNSTAKLNSTVYYLGSNINGDVTSFTNKNNYSKTTYNSLNGSLTMHTVNESVPGNTVIVSAVKVSAPTVKTFYGESEKKEFDEFPIKWDVSATAEIPSNTIFNKAEIVVYLPKYLVYTTASLGTKAITPTVETNSQYTILTFTFDSETIVSTDNNSFDNEVNFVFYTDRAFDTPEKANQEVKITSNFYVQDSSNASTLYSDISSDESRTTTHTITIYNNGEILTSGDADPKYINASSSYTYNMKSFNNSGSSSNLELLYVLPYVGDTSTSNTGSVVKGTFNIKLDSLPDGYKVYYTEADPKTILGNEIDDASVPGLNNWKEWTNYTIETSNIKAIKIISTNSINSGQYFTTSNGIKVTVIPKNNEIGDEYYNRFVMISKDSNNKVLNFVNSSSSVVSVYNRKISGFVFSDSDYDGLYTSSIESTMADIPVEIYKVSNSEAKKDSSVLEVMSSEDKKVDETVTDAEGQYTFRGLEEGLYYVKFSFDCDKYTVTDKLVVSDALANSSSVNSNANMLSDSCAAVSDIVEVNNNNTEVSNINLGLAVKKVFGVDLKKYITKVVVNSNKGSSTYEYNNETKVKIDIKSLKNTSFRVTYKFELSNSKYFPGYVSYIIESIPDGMTFDQSLSENDGWVKSGNQLYYTKLSDTLISPGEKYYFSVVLDLATDTAGDYVNIISASDFKILGEDPIKLDFSDLILDDESNNSEQENVNNTENSSENE